MNQTELKIMDFINNYTARQECFPTFREIADGCHINSTGYVHEIIKRLVENGHLKIHPGRNRGIVSAGNIFASIVTVIKRHNDSPSVIEWQGRRYVLDMKG